MKKIIILFIALYATCTLAKQLDNANEVLKKIGNTNFNQNCDIDNYTMLKMDKVISDKVDLLLNEFGGFKLTDFDMRECLNNNNYDGKNFLTLFWQKNNEFKGHHLDLIVSVNYETKKTLLVVLDNDSNAYFLGDLTEDFILSLKNSIYRNNLKNVDFESKLTFSDLKTKVAPVLDESEVKKLMGAVNGDTKKEPEWYVVCKKDKFNGMKSCSMMLNDIMVIVIENYISVYVGRDHFPDSLSAIKIDNNKAVYGQKGMIKTPSNVLEQMKTGRIAYSRYMEWPYRSYKDSEVDLAGFTRQFNAMMSRYKAL